MLMILASACHVPPAEPHPANPGDNEGDKQIIDGPWSIRTFDTHTNPPTELSRAVGDAAFAGVPAGGCSKSTPCSSDEWYLLPAGARWLGEQTAWWIRYDPNATLMIGGGARRVHVRVAWQSQGPPPEPEVNTLKVGFAGVSNRALEFHEQGTYQLQVADQTDAPAFGKGVVYIRRNPAKNTDILASAMSLDVEEILCWQAGTSETERLYRPGTKAGQNKDREARWEVAWSSSDVPADVVCPPGHQRTDYQITVLRSG